MHRLHHLHSDTPQDPHSPVHNSFVIGMLRSMHFSFVKTMKGLAKNDEPYTSIVSDLAFPSSWVAKNEVMIFMPTILHILIAIFLALTLDSWLLGLSYWLGMMSHPFQGWLVNSVGHKYGYQTFQLNDNSYNNTWVGLFVAGEGYQNNHHRFPVSAKFSIRHGEYDMGYTLCKVMEKLGILQIHYHACANVLSSASRWQSS
jgi:stearoyl-CoA desaturase (delta-9 desaturase)